MFLVCRYSFVISLLRAMLSLVDDSCRIVSPIRQRMRNCTQLYAQWKQPYPVQTKITSINYKWKNTFNWKSLLKKKTHNLHASPAFNSSLLLSHLCARPLYSFFPPKIQTAEVHSHCILLAYLHLKLSRQFTSHLLS